MVRPVRASCRVLADQAALHGVLAKIRDLKLKLISVNRRLTKRRQLSEHRRESPHSLEVPARSTRTTQSCSS